MKDTAKDYKTAAELRAELAALNLRLAFQEEFEEEVDALIEESQTADPEILKLAEQSDARILQMIRRKLRKRKMQRLFSDQLPKAGKVAAACLLIFYIGLTTAIAAIPSVRSEVMHLIMKFEERYISLELKHNREFSQISEEWMGYYYPTSISQEFQFVMTDGYSAYYNSQDGRNLIFSEYGEGSSVNIDSENAQISFVELNGENGLIVEKNDWTTLVWAIPNHYFLIEIQGNQDEALAIARSVVPVR